MFSGEVVPALHPELATVVQLITPREEAQGTRVLPEKDQDWESKRQLYCSYHLGNPKSFGSCVPGREMKSKYLLFEKIPPLSHPSLHNKGAHYSKIIKRNYETIQDH